jgi:MFS family permease
MDPRKNISVMRMVSLNVINFGLVAFWAYDGAVMPLLLTSKFGLSNTVISLIIGIGKLMIGLSLFFGLYSDLTQAKWGKRRPLMLVGGLICAPLIAFIPHIPSVWLLAIVMTVVYFGVQLASVPYYALVPEVVPNEKLGTANAFFSVFGGVGTLVAYVILLSIVYKINKPLAFYIMAASVLIGTLVSVFSTKEHLGEPPKKVNRFLAMIKCVKEVANDLPNLPDLSIFLIGNLCFWLALGAFLVYFTKFMEYYVNIPGTDAGIVLGVVVIVSILLAVPIGLIGDKWSRKKMTQIGMIVVFIGLLAGYFTVGPFSPVSGYNLAEQSAVKKLAEKIKYDMSGADLSPFANEQFAPPLDINNDGMFDKKSDVMRWCLNGALKGEECEKAAAKVLKPGSPALAPTTAAFKEIGSYVQKNAKRVMMIAFGIIGFSAIGLTACFVIMATILPTLMPEEKMGLYMGFYSTVTGVGQLLSLLLAGFVIDKTLASPALGYRWVFMQGAFFMLIAAFALSRVPYIPNAKDPTISDLAKKKKAVGK